MYQVKVDPLCFKMTSITSDEFTITSGYDDVTKTSVMKMCDGNQGA